ncbi:MAG: tandem-95 repeat protein [Planctomycetaceae bacterium]|nr:tandem-95 repeat protein [Planctomycetales bacterium]MCB9924063.1 tandem-95 repeat protein [Planctomycetaceae bacterium]
MESLEERNLLASDIGMATIAAEGEGPDPLLSVRLSVVDPETLLPLEELHQGDEFILLANVNDLRPEASGVFAAYLDLVYPSEFFSVPADNGQAVIIYGSEFGNGRSGDLLSGEVDELGTFASSTNPPGSGEQQLVGVRLVATMAGEAHISSNPADVSPDHDLLLFDRDNPVPSDLVVYGDLTLNVLPPLAGHSVDAIGDFLEVDENSFENALDVLGNDRNLTGSPLVITGLDLTNSRGEVKISEDGTHLLYTPSAGFVGTDQFSYTIMADGEEDTTTVRVDVKRVDLQQDLVAYGLEVTDSMGNPVSAVTVGEEFVLHVTAEDLRVAPAGVFGAYLDVQYTSEFSEVSGPIKYSPEYPNDHVGDISVAGLIDEVGAFSGTQLLGGGAFEVFQIPFQATSPGQIVFESNPADNVPFGQTLLFNVDDSIADEDITFGRVTLRVLPSIIAVDDSFDVLDSTAVQSFAVLENDVSLLGEALSLVSVDGTGLQGTVAIAGNGRDITYTPASGFQGSEQFSYTISGLSGTSKGEVTVHMQPTAASDDEVEIRLVTTDLQGNEISSIPAGQEFIVQALVRDLRERGSDRGVYAAYFDLLYQSSDVHIVESQGGVAGPMIVRGSDYANGGPLDASVAGILNDVGAFQTGTTPLGSREVLLFSAHFRAAAARGEADSIEILEDTQSSLSVLDNDLPASGSTTFQADPSDIAPLSDVLFYEPVETVPYEKIRYGSATLSIAAGGDAVISSVSAGSAGGTISIVDGGKSLLYSPRPNFNGVETFTYSLNGESPTRVSVNVLPVNDAPVAENDVYRVRENQLLTVNADVGVLANDLEYDGDNLEAQLVGGTAHGTLQFAQDGSFSYLPEAGYLGRDSFTYKVTDGQLESALATVAIDVVPRPVRIRLEAVNADGDAISDFAADETVTLRTLVQDLRSPSDFDLGLGAVYLDVVYDANAISPATVSGAPNLPDAKFRGSYSNVITGEIVAGRLNDIGALQTGFQPLGGDELELFHLDFNTTGPRAVDDSFIVAGGTDVNRLNLLVNEGELRWEVTVDAQHAANSPGADVAYLDPAEAVPEDDIRYEDITLAVRNGDLSIQSVGATESGAEISIVGSGAVNYVPLPDYTGVDTFTYTVVDAQGRTATATVSVAVTRSWQNVVEPSDVTGDGIVSPLDALVIVNVLNSKGSHELGSSEIDAFIDVDGNGFVSPLDVLLVINRLLKNSLGPEGESSLTVLSSEDVDTAAASYPSLIPVGAIQSSTVIMDEPTPLRSELLSIDDLRVSVLCNPSASSVLPNNAFGHLEENNRDTLEMGDLLEEIAPDIAPLWEDFS